MNGPENSERRFSRRAFVGGMAGMAVAGGLAGGGGVEVYRRHTESLPAYYAYESYVYKYPRVSSERRRRLLSSFALESSPLAMRQEDEEKVGSFLASPDTLYGLEVRGKKDPQVSLQSVTISVGEDKFLAPIIQSSEYASCPVYIGEMKGKQEIKVSAVDEESPLDVDLRLIALSGDAFVRGVIRNIPKLYVREDNENNLTNDVPLNSNLFLRENWFQVIMPEYWMRYSAESNQHVPYPLVDEEGRVWDYDATILAKMTIEGEKLEEARMGKGHKIYLSGQHPAPNTLPWGERAEYQIIEKNNMVSQEVKTDIACSYIPDDFLDLNQKVYEDRERAVTALSIREYVREGTLAAGDPFVLSVINNQLDGIDLITPFT